MFYFISFYFHTSVYIQYGTRLVRKIFRAVNLISKWKKILDFCFERARYARVNIVFFYFFEVNFVISTARSTHRHYRNKAIGTFNSIDGDRSLLLPLNMYNINRIFSFSFFVITRYFTYSGASRGNSVTSFSLNFEIWRVEWLDLTALFTMIYLLIWTRI